MPGTSAPDPVNSRLAALPTSAPAARPGQDAAQQAHPCLPLPNPATVVVVGGGPAGSFFAIRLLRRARQVGRVIRVVILEKKTEVCFYQPVTVCAWEGCNYCAGGISPRLADILHEEGISLPDEVVESRAEEVVVHGDWKSVRLAVPPGREMLSVFRGSRPRRRPGRYENFDTFLLRTAIAAGAEVVTGNATRVWYSAERRPVIGYQTQPESPAEEAATKAPGGGAPLATTRLVDETIEADFAVFAGGVNYLPGSDVSADPLFRELRNLVPGLRPPKVRKALIAEMQARGSDPDVLLAVDKEVHFVQYGSKNLHIEMSSLLPKHNWVTVVLLGKSIDHARPAEYLEMMQEFVELPQIRRLLPPGVHLRPGCSCHPNMTVGAARSPYGERLALTGDMAVSRLYKDGLYSAWTTAAGLADCLLDHGIDRSSLGRWYAPVVTAFDRDNRYGRVIFLLSRGVFSRPALSRVLYQAILTERKTTFPEEWRLATLLWQIASGDSTYRRILRGMLHPASIWLILTGGLLITARNKATEELFALDWTGIGRHQTGVSLADRLSKRKEIYRVLGLGSPSRAPDMERVYSIRIRAGEEAIFRQLGKFGDPDREYLRPRFITIGRVAGAPNEVGTTIRYDIGAGGGPNGRFRVPPVLSFTVRLEQIIPGRYLLYRILDGFGRGGVFSFDLHPLKPGVNLLSIYVGFDFHRGTGPVSRLGWRLFRWLFPGFAHDVIWNHSLCKIRYLAETDMRSDYPPEETQ